MKQLSEFKDEKAIEIVAKLLNPIVKIVTNPENAKLKDLENGFDMFSGFFANTPRAIMDIFAILSEVDPAEYHCNAAEAMQNLVKLVSDPDLMKLFH